MVVTAGCWLWHTKVHPAGKPGRGRVKCRALRSSSFTTRAGRLPISTYSSSKVRVTSAPMPTIVFGAMAAARCEESVRAHVAVLADGDRFRSDAIVVEIVPVRVEAGAASCQRHAAPDPDGRMYVEEVRPDDVGIFSDAKLRAGVPNHRPVPRPGL